ncbi:PaaI family thioesterase [Sporosarcina sp. ACRSL]|uniref:PaaI family thioesterase n=1 Tax=Sporosarcina sp. ACRSL TaxID=2918215 RepID=UPI001EF55287|nr:PaaI family thioesterase [Sporosarcina sp. ACRSL]MCG7344083.1 PaaI family thioesterase [Sporosarcina sp. ACRSL]
METETTNNIEQSKMKIASKLDGLSLKQLEEVDYLLSTYKELIEAPQRDKAPMHLYGRLTGLKKLEEDQVEMTLGPHNVNTYGVAQGGSLYTLADVAIGFMILRRLSEDQKVFTLEMKMNFIKKGAGAQLIAIPTIIRWGKTTIVAECTIEDSEGDIVAKALGTFYIAS